MDEIYQSVNGINAFTLLIESRISERPFSVGDYFEFMKLCSEYTYPQASQKIHLGHPIFLEHFREKKTNIDLDVLNGHGLVCGKPDSGKSNSVIVLSLALAKKGITVHLLDVKGDLTEELRKKSEVTTELDLVDVDLNLILQGNQLDLDSCKSQSIYLYALNKLTDDERVSVANSLLNSLQRTQRSKALRHIVFFEEAHKIFTQEQKRLIANLSAAVNIVREMGIGIYLIVQELTRIPFLEVRGELLYLYNQLQNRIIHAVYDSPEEKNIAVRLLVPTGVPKERLFYDIESEITRLSKGEAFVSFLSSDKKPQPPIKIEFLKEKA
jgi:hypothetical protein